MVETSLELSDSQAQALFEQGNTYFLAGEVLQARACYERAIEVNPQLGLAHFNLGATYQAQGLHHLALPHYECGVALMDDPGIYLGNVLNTKMRICDWRGLDALIAQIQAKVCALEPTCPPFQVISFSDSPHVQRKAAELWMSRVTWPDSWPTFVPTQKDPAQKIRVAYFSADLTIHPVAYLTAGLFELHDKSRFEIVVFSSSLARPDPYRARIEAVCDQWVDIHGQSDEQVTELARQMELDIAVELTGLTQGGRMSVLKARVAPVQMHYLGYPATSATPNVDYILADLTLIPPQLREHYSEKIIYLPHCFQVSDARRPQANSIEDRRQALRILGLREDQLQHFVFCSFCNTYKITPTVFANWMLILQAVPASVLVLYADSEVTQNFLRDHALAHGIAPERVIFCKRVSVSDYLARLTVCDLFLDTFPYNGGTTANDVLWMGLPLLTLAGQTMTGRMAASLLHALGLDDLVTHSWTQYVQQAIALANQPERYQEIRLHLQQAREQTPVFDTLKTTRAIEQGYQMALQRHQQGLPPDHLYVPA